MQTTLGINHVELVLERAGCGRHSVPKGVPCWSIRSRHHGDMAAICNKRAIAAGFVGTPSDKSLRKS